MRLIEDRPGLVVAAGVVDEHVESAVFLQVRHQRVALFGVGHIEMYRRAPDGGLHPFGTVVVDVGDPHVSARQRKRSGDPFTDAGRRSGNQGDLAIEGEKAGDLCVHG